MVDRIRGRLGITMRKRRLENEPDYKQWYGTARWKRMREAQKHKEPFCEMCRPRLTIATVADHKEPHRGDPLKFWDPDNLQSLCGTHHNSDKQRIEKGGTPKPVIGIDGWHEEA